MVWHRPALIPLTRATDSSNGTPTAATDGQTASGGVLNGPAS